mgnify:CR=1 FL=1
MTVTNMAVAIWMARQFWLMFDLLDSISLNARATFTWNAFPGEVVNHAATVGAGLSWQALHATRTEDFLVQAFWDE